MSEPLTSSEIEDVLSSIRRLVSDDIRPMARNVSPAPQPSAEPTSVRAEDKLLLTPALRVVQTEPRNERDDGWYAERVEPAAENAAPDEFGMNTVVTRLGAQMPAFSEEWENEEGDAVLTEVDPKIRSDDWEDFTANDAFEEDAFLTEAHSGAATSDVRDMVQPEEILPYRQYEDEAELFAPENADDQIPGWAQSVAEDDSGDELIEEDHSVETKEVPFVSARSTAWADAAEASVIASLAMQERPSRIHRAGFYPSSDRATLPGPNLLPTRP